MGPEGARRRRRIQEEPGGAIIDIECLYEKGKASRKPIKPIKLISDTKNSQTKNLWATCQDRGSQTPGGARRSQEETEEPGGARRSQEEPGGVRRSHNGHRVSL